MTLPPPPMDARPPRLPSGTMFLVGAIILALVLLLLAAFAFAKPSPGLY